MSKSKPKVKTYLFMMNPHTDDIMTRQIKGTSPYDALIKSEVFSNDVKNLYLPYLRKKDVVSIANGVYNINDGSCEIMVVVKLS